MMPRNGGMRVGGGGLRRRIRTLRAGEPGSWNRYGYVGGDPVNYVDPRGLQKCLVGSITTTFLGESSTTLLWEDCSSMADLWPGSTSSVPSLVRQSAQAVSIRAWDDVHGTGWQNPQVICNAAPDGRTISLNGALGIIGGVSVSAEVVLDYHAGTATLVASAGFGPSGAAAQVGISTGFIFGTGNSVPNYASGGNTTVSMAIPSGLGVSVTANSGGLTGNPAMISALSATAVQVGFSVGLVSLLGGFSAAAQNTLTQIPLGTVGFGALATPSDYVFWGLQQECK
jgi:hypothetical protein